MNVILWQLGSSRRVPRLNSSRSVLADLAVQVVELSKFPDYKYDAGASLARMPGRIINLETGAVKNASGHGFRRLLNKITGRSC